MNSLRRTLRCSKLIPLCVAIGSVALTCTLPSTAQIFIREDSNFDNEIIYPEIPPVDPTPPPVVVTPPPPPVVTPPPPEIVITPPPPPVILPPPVVHTPIYTGPQPIDLTNAAANVAPNLPKPPLPLLGNAVDGMQAIAEFPAKDTKGNADWILVRGEKESVYERPNPYTAKLEQGTILVSVRRPSQQAFVETPAGDVALHSDGDLMLTWTDGLLRIYNISALGSDCKIKFSPEVIGDDKARTVKLKAGFEVVASPKRELTRADLRPSDGIARRRAQLVANGRIGISEFQVQSVLANSAIVAQMMAEQTNKKESRVLADMSKMAAVLNYVNGYQGYTIEGKTGLATAPAAQPH